MIGKHFAESQYVLMSMYRNPLDKKNCRRMDVDAEAINVPLSTLQKYVSGVLACPVEILKKLYAHTRDPRLKKLLTPEGFRIIPEEPHALFPTNTNSAFNEGLAQLGEFFRLYETYKNNDGMIDKNELEDLCSKGALGVDAVEEIILNIKREVVQA